MLVHMASILKIIYLFKICLKEHAKNARKFLMKNTFKETVLKNYLIIAFNKT